MDSLSLCHLLELHVGYSRIVVIPNMKVYSRKVARHRDARLSSHIFNRPTIPGQRRVHAVSAVIKVMEPGRIQFSARQAWFRKLRAFIGIS